GRPFHPKFRAARPRETTPCGRHADRPDGQERQWQWQRGRAQRHARERRTSDLTPLTHRCVMADVVEEVQLQGHIIDSLLRPKVLDEILTRGGTYVIKDIRIGQRGTDPSQARLEVRAPNADRLHEILNIIHDHGADPVHAADCESVPADMDGAFPEGFYST